MIWTEYGTNTQRLSILQSTPRHSGTKIVIKIWKITGFQSRLKTRNFSKILLKRLNAIYLTKKFKKLPTRIAVYRNL